MYMVTMRDVAREAGVSVSTVSHVINGTRYVSPELTRRVQAAMEKLDYQPNKVARSLRTKRTHMVSLIVSDISNPFFATIVRGAEDAAAENGFDLVVVDSDENPDKESKALEALLQKNLEGFIIAPTGELHKGLQRLLTRKVPLVFVDRKVSNIQTDSVLSDNISGAYKATNYLIQLGHTRIGIILGLEKTTPSQERFEGYKRALAEAGLPLREELVVRGGFKMEGGEKACRKLISLTNPPTAILVLNNRMLLGVMRALRDTGFLCPQDISVVGFDDFEWMAMFDPPVTAVAQYPYQMGYQATKLLLSRIRERETKISPRELRISCRLVIRASVTHPASSEQWDVTTQRNSKGGDS